MPQVVSDSVISVCSIFVHRPSMSMLNSFSHQIYVFSYLPYRGSTDVSNVLVIGDNYEASVIFLVSGYQYISSAIAYNFGYEHRGGWFTNWRFSILSIGYSIMLFYVALVPSKLSCLFRVNCANDDVVRQVTSGGGDELMPIQNPYNTTVMPVEFRWTIAAIMFANLLANIVWEYFFVNGILKRAMQVNRNNKGEKRVLLTAPSEVI
jgi:hypothetical protein